MKLHLRATDCHLSYGITQCYLSPDASEHTPALTPAIQAGTRFTYPGGMEGWVDLVDWLHTEMVYPQQTVTRALKYTISAVHGRESNSRPVGHKCDKSDALTTTPPSDHYVAGSTPTTTRLSEPFASTTLVKRVFRCSAAATWNSLPRTVTDNDSLGVGTFKSRPLDISVFSSI